MFNLNGGTKDEGKLDDVSQASRLQAEYTVGRSKCGSSLVKGSVVW